jgi:hypothetical protein
MLYGITQTGYFKRKEVTFNTRTVPTFLESLEKNPLLKNYSDFDLHVTRDPAGNASIGIRARVSGELISLSRFQLTGYPANCGLVIMSEFTCKPRLKLTPLMLQFIRDFCKYDLGYSVIEITVPTVDSDEDKTGYYRFYEIAEGHGYKTVYEFHNRRSGNTIAVMRSQLN